MTFQVSFSHMFKQMELKVISLNCRFTKAISDEINVVQEGGTLSLEVQRQRGSFRDVHVRWEITPNAGIANASSQISPMNGTISFRQVSVLSPHFQTFLQISFKLVIPTIAQNSDPSGRLRNSDPSGRLRTLIYHLKRSMTGCLKRSVNHWLRSIETYTFLWKLTLVSGDKAYMETGV